MWAQEVLAFTEREEKKKWGIEELPEGRKFRQKVPTPGESK